jgi:hypothetical protein
MCTARWHRCTVDLALHAEAGARGASASGIELDGDAFLQGIRIDMQDGTQTDIRMTDTRDAGPLTALEKQALGLP